MPACIYITSLKPFFST